MESELKLQTFAFLSYFALAAVIALTAAYLHIKRVNRELRRCVHELEIDALTQTYRREVWETKVAEGLKHTSFIICFFDMDNFKEVNDVLGHSHGDNILSLLGSALRIDLKERDLAGRYGGDEFVVALDGAKSEDLRNIVERIRQRFKEKVRAYFKAEGLTEIALDFSYATVDVPYKRRIDETLYFDLSAKLRTRKKQK